MSDLFRLIWCALIGIFRPRATLQAEILVLRHQLIVLRRKSPKRLAFGNVDRLVLTAVLTGNQIRAARMMQCFCLMRRTQAGSNFRKRQWPVCEDGSFYANKWPSGLCTNSMTSGDVIRHSLLTFCGPLCLLRPLELGFGLSALLRMFGHGGTYWGVPAGSEKE